MTVQVGHGRFSTLNDSLSVLPCGRAFGRADEPREDKEHFCTSRSQQSVLEVAYGDYRSRSFEGQTARPR